MRLGFAADHAGYLLKNDLLSYVSKLGYSVHDLGTSNAESVDYFDYAKLGVMELISNHIDRLILVCGTGVGMSMSANRFVGVRAVVCSDVYTAKFSRAHNNCNVLCLGARVVGIGLAQAIIEAWLNVPFEGGRHMVRLDKLDTHLALDLPRIDKGRL